MNIIFILLLSFLTSISNLKNRTKETSQQMNPSQIRRDWEGFVILYFLCVLFDKRCEV